MRYIGDTECGTKRMILQVMNFDGFPFQMQFLLRLFFFFGSRIAYLSVFSGAGVGAGLFPYSYKDLMQISYL